MPCPSASLAVWSAAWVAGSVSADDVLDALVPWGEAHDVVGADPATADALELPTPDRAGAGLVAALGLLRRAAAGGLAEARIVLPTPGDVRGTPGPPAVRAAALEAGEAVVVADHRDGRGLALVPHAVADGVLRWTVHRTEPLPPPAQTSLSEADQELRAGVRDAAAALGGLEVARPRRGVREEIADTLRARPRPEWPAGTPGRPLRVLAHADEVEAILRAAGADAPGGALTSAATLARTDALRPLATAVREARTAAVAETVRVLAGV